MEVDEADPAIFFQTEEFIQPDAAGRSWRLPIEPVYKEQKGLGPMKDAATNWASYQKRCYLIAKNWDSPLPDNWIPQELHNTTPYSFALLDGLYNTSKHSKKMRTDCLNYLLQSVYKRADLTANAATPWIETQVNQAGCEAVIRERLDGVLLADMAALLQAITTGEIKAAKAERSKQHTEHSKAKALQRVLDRREAKVTTQVAMQRELWNDKAGRTELVGIEFGSDKDHAESGVLTKKKLNKLAKKMHKSQALAESLRIQSARAKTKDIRKDRAATLDQLTAKLKEDEENAWTDNSDDDADLSMPHHAMPQPNELEPRRSNRQNRRKLGEVPAMVGDIDVLAEEASDYVVKPPVHNPKKWVRSPKTAKRTRVATEQWYNEKLAQSVQLPSERFDFSQLPKLESNAQRESIDGMMGALDAMGVNQPK